MIFESTYRRQAFDQLKQENEATKIELKMDLEQKKALTKNPIVYAFTSILLWFSQQ